MSPRPRYDRPPLPLPVWLCLLEASNLICSPSPWLPRSLRAIRAFYFLPLFGSLSAGTEHKILSGEKTCRIISWLSLTPGASWIFLLSVQDACDVQKHLKHLILTVHNWTIAKTTRKDLCDFLELFRTTSSYNFISTKEFVEQISNQSGCGGLHGRNLTSNCHIHSRIF